MSTKPIQFYYDGSAIEVLLESVDTMKKNLTKEETLEAKAPTESLVQLWAKKINACNAVEAKSTISYAKSVAEAKAELCEHGKWTELCRSGLVPFKKSKGDMLVFVGKKMAELDDQTLGHLPSGWSILHCLACIPADKLEELVEKEIVSPLLTLSQAKELAAPYRKPKSKPQKSVQKWLELCQRFIEEEKPKWDESQARFVADTLVEIADGVTQ